MKKKTLFIPFLVVIVIISLVYLYFQYFSKDILSPSSNKTSPQISPNGMRPQVKKTFGSLQSKNVFTVFAEGFTVETDKDLFDKLMLALSVETGDQGDSVYQEYKKRGVYIRFLVSSNFPDLPMILYQESPDGPVLFATDRKPSDRKNEYAIEATIYINPELLAMEQTKKQKILSQSIISLLLTHFSVETKNKSLNFQKYTTNQEYFLLVTLK